MCFQCWVKIYCSIINERIEVEQQISSDSFFFRNIDSENSICLSSYKYGRSEILFIADENTKNVKKWEISEAESKFSGKGSEFLLKKSLSSEISICRCK